MNRFAAVALATLTSVSIAASASAGQRQPVREPAEVTVLKSTLSAQETKDQLERLLNEYPPSLVRVLRLDPTLLTNQPYLQPYPALVTFLTEHPEIAHNPVFFLGNDNSRAITDRTRSSARSICGVRPSRALPSRA